MKILTKISTYLLATPYLVLGLNYFFNFIPMPQMEGVPGQYLGLLYSTGILLVIKVIEISVALSLFSGFQRPIALIVIAPISINILLFELLVAKMPGIGILLVALNAFLIYAHKEKYLPIIR
jgi:hypothetical protein